MMEIQHTVVIDRPVEDVFNFLSDASNDRLWETGVEACVPDREPSVGQKRDVVMKVFGRRYEGVAEVTEFDSNRRLTIEIQSGLPVKGESRFEFDSINGSTQIDYSLRATPVNRVFKMAQSVMGWMLQRQWEDDLQALKDLLESEEGQEASVA